MDEKISRIIAGHLETVDGLKDENQKLKVETDKLGNVQKELDGLKAEGSYKEKYETEKAEHEKLVKQKGLDFSSPELFFYCRCYVLYKLFLRVIQLEFHDIL